MKVLLYISKCLAGFFIPARLSKKPKVKVVIMLLGIMGFIFIPHSSKAAYFEAGEQSVSNTTDNGTWVSIGYSGTYVNPVIIVGPISRNNTPSLFPRVRNVTSSGFEIGMQNECENKGLGGVTDLEILDNLPAGVTVQSIGTPSHGTVTP